MNMKGIVITAVAIRTGWKALGLISIPASCKNGRGNTVKSQNAIRIAII
jgi:hypothetical protein